MSYIDEKIKELENIRNEEELSYKRQEKNELLLNEFCDEIINAPLAGNYFSKEVSKYLAHSCFSSFSAIKLDEEECYISDFGDEILFSKYKGMNSITYKTSDGKKSIKLYKSNNKAFIKKEDKSREEDFIVSGELRVYNIAKDPIFEKAKKIYN